MTVSEIVARLAQGYSRGDLLNSEAWALIAELSQAHREPRVVLSRGKIEFIGTAEQVAEVLLEHGLKRS